MLIQQSLLVIQSLEKVDTLRKCSERARENFDLVWMNLNDGEVSLALRSTDFYEGKRLIGMKW